MAHGAARGADTFTLMGVVEWEKKATDPYVQEAADRDGDEEAKARLMGITREQLLCEIEREKHRKTFRMPKEELLIAGACVRVCVCR